MDAAGGPARPPPGGVVASPGELALRAALAARQSTPLAVGTPAGLAVPTAYPVSYLVNSYAGFAGWAAGSLELVRPQLVELAFPLLVLTAMEVLLTEPPPGPVREAGGAAAVVAGTGAPLPDALAAARHLLEAHAPLFDGGPHASELAALALLTRQRQLFGEDTAATAAAAAGEASVAPGDAGVASAGGSADADALASPTNTAVASLMMLGGAAAAVAAAAPAADPAVSARQRREARLRAALARLGVPSPATAPPLSAAVGDAAAKPAARRSAASALVAGDAALAGSSSGSSAVSLPPPVDGDALARWLTPGLRYGPVVLSPLALQLALEFLARGGQGAFLLGALNERVAVRVVADGDGVAAALGSDATGGGSAAVPAGALGYPATAGAAAVAGAVAAASALLQGAPDAGGRHLTGGYAGASLAMTHSLRWGVLPGLGNPGSAAPGVVLGRHYMPAPGAGASTAANVAAMRSMLVPWPDYVSTPLGRALVSAAAQREASAAARRARLAAGQGGPSAAGVLAGTGDVGGGGKRKARDAASTTADADGPATFELTALTLTSAAPGASPAAAVACCAVVEPALLPAAGAGADALPDDDDGVLRVVAAGFADGHVRVHVTVRLAVGSGGSSAATTGAGAGAGASSAPLAPQQHGAPPDTAPPAVARTVDVPLPALTCTNASARSARGVTGVSVSPCGRYVAAACVDGRVRLYALGPAVRAGVRAVVARVAAAGVPVVPPPALQQQSVAAGGASPSSPSLLESLASETLAPLAAYGGGGGGGALSGGGLPVWAVAWNPLSPGVFASGGRDGAVRVWSTALAPGPVVSSPGPLGGGGADVTALGWHPNGTLVMAGAGDGCLRVVDAATGETVRLLPPGPHRAPVTAVAVAPCGRWAASGDEDGVVVVWDLPSGTPAGRAALGTGSGSGGVGGGATGGPLGGSPRDGGSSSGGASAGGAPAVYGLGWDPATSGALVVGDAAGGVALWRLRALLER